MQKELESENESEFKVIYDSDIQKIIEEKLYYYSDDVVVNLVQISIISILNYLEKIIETELYILEGTPSTTKEK